MEKPLGVILAGGQARRMGGGDKGLLELGGRPLMARVIERLEPQVRKLAINANGDPARFAAFDLPVLPDSVAGFPGPLAGVLAGLDWAAGEGADVIVTVAADTPFFPADLADFLVRAAEGMDHPLVLAATPRGNEATKSMSRSGLVRHPTFGLWPVALREDLRETLEAGVSKVVVWTERHGGREAVFGRRGGDPFFNVNTPEDLETARSML
ncbi:molybdenum cofactor guanylyltransferase MobA [Marivita sp. GX14005]|uniref:molybdenum cofactor guanylyltransferase MobA n=1 Tax=Marivita sp. GX14005 TaxID=2942276 RepID=UPI0020190C08|nr:molybdenum cofactor guanylyltransferase MobA [Marivita sp. GX14005]MCL3881814.1 molybdenum cofactor guanylyltransferase MobA [Marivita sp. GX14005]